MADVVIRMTAAEYLATPEGEPPHAELINGVVHPQGELGERRRGELVVGGGGDLRALKS